MCSPYDPSVQAAGCVLPRDGPARTDWPTASDQREGESAMQVKAVGGPASESGQPAYQSDWPAYQSYFNENIFVTCCTGSWRYDNL